MPEAEDAFPSEGADTSHIYPDLDVNQESGLERSGTPVGVPSTVIEPPNVYKSRWRSIRVMYLTMFLSSVSFSICMSSIWPYLRMLDRSATTAFLGWVVAAYSLGQLAASPVFGAWATCRRRSREPLVVSIVINILANLMYAYIVDIPGAAYRKYYLIVARALIGFGAGNVAVVRSYTSGATTIKERTGAMASMSACQATGFILGPGIQAMLVPLGYPIKTSSDLYKYLPLNLYTAPVFLSAVLGLVNVVLLVVVFREHTVVDDSDLDFSRGGSVNADLNEYDAHLQDTTPLGIEVKPDRIAVLVLLFIFFIVLFVFSIFETIATPLTMDEYAWTEEQASLYVGITLAVAGIIAIVVFILIKILSRKLNERFILIGGFIFVLAGFIVYLPWGPARPDVEIAKLTNSSSASVTDMSGMIMEEVEVLGRNVTAAVTTIKTTVTAHTTDLKPAGCPYYFSWCLTTPKIFIEQYFSGTFLIAVGYPTTNVMTYTLFSKILGPKPQGIMMGWLTASGSLARTLGPIFVSQFYQNLGPRWTFSIIAGVVVVTIGVIIGMFKKLVPYQVRWKRLSPR
ncbi:major facilitator superfamily domain-containing protein 8 isoform X5 [Lingula anatina]|uniref:Major facilitator superfamily domain-containing protein 8 isoform X5 n=1 Tax=Lingula anatina TaxID=7574 RepID=A0A1S3HLB8_LINAN|nr:major facilitator superfamily domain-containing protein 8 isoform X5 [Lingula anatina]|eukprot:XP_013386256.1 major facilitator superfamily domain-containing protein 8 isoform X5 [Lingula anatina]